jgi:hypothetical protein
MAATEHSRAKKRAYRAANHDKIKAQRRAYRVANREKIKAYKRVYRRTNPEKCASWVRNWSNTWFGAYSRHKLRAARRKIDFLLTFEEWTAIWQASGKWEQRGTRRGQYVMARYGDRGPYAAGNVRICTCAENMKEAHHCRRSFANAMAYGFQP